MASDRRSSTSSIRSSISRSSISSNKASRPQMSPLPSSKPFTAGSSLPAPSPPHVPPKDRLPLPMTPKRKPIQRQKSPLSSEAFANPTSTMPGAFPDTPSSPAGLPDADFHTAAYSENVTPSSTLEHKGSRRLSAMRNLMTFKSLRRSYDNTSSSPTGVRPTTPGADSMVSNSTRPSLKKKMSGTFWKRKSSLGMGFSAGEEERTNGHASSPTTNGQGHDTVVENPRPITPVMGDEMLPIKKRKSGTFWRRKSSLTLTETVNAEKQGWANKPPEIAVDEDWNGQDKGEPVEIEGRLSEEQSPPLFRSYSPPPQLPELVSGGGGLELGEDLFKDIH
ncbi:MAG: hypothetical protein Q9164_001170 [Protoblastenia rupestris]